MVDKPADLPHYHPLVIVLGAVCAGIAADRFCPQHLLVWFAITMATLCLWYLFRRLRHDRVAAFVLMLAILCLSAAWHHLRWNLFDANDLGNYAQAKVQPVALEAIALSAPRLLPTTAPGKLRWGRDEPIYRFEISACAIRDADKWIPITGRALLYVQGAVPPLELGDRIRIFGSLSAPRAAHNPGEFDRAQHLRGHRIRAMVQAESADCVSIIQPGGPWNVSRWLERARCSASELFEQYLDPRQAELASAVFLGQREQIDYERNETFMITGTIHILSISGLHVGILAGALLWIMRRSPLPQAWGLALVALIITLYALMVDVEPPVVRATILVLLICLAMYLGRPALGFNLLAAAALVVLAINPTDLFSVGAQLSFLSVAVLMWLWPRWAGVIRQDQILQKMAERHMHPVLRILWWLRHSLMYMLFTGSAIWIVTQPLVMARFNIFSPIALVLNALLWIPMTLGLLSGFVFLFLATLVPPLACIAAFCCNLNLWLLEQGVNLAAAVPGSHFWAPGPENWWLAGFYGGLFALVALPKIRPRPRWCLALLVGWIAIGFTASLAKHDSNRLHCTVLSVGHGCAVVLELPSGKTMLYDAGQFGAPDRAARIIAGCLWSRGITRVDAVVLSHPDVDHYNALPELLEKCSVGAVYVSPLMFDLDSPSLKTLKAELGHAKVPVREISAGDHLGDNANCRLEVLHPSGSGTLDNDNANSLVLLVEYSGHRILLPGDLESPGLDQLLAAEPVHCDVLLAPHHGSRKSNSPSLAEWCRPDWVVFSGDGRWTLPEIDATYQAVGSRTFHTFQSGAVEVTIDNGGVTVDTFIKQ